MRSWRSLGTLVLAVVTASGCIYSWNGERTTVRKPVTSKTRPRADVLPGRAEVVPDGTIRFAVELERLCQRDRATREEIGVERRKRFNTLGQAVMGVSAAAIVTGVWMVTQYDSSADLGFLLGGVYTIVGGAAGIVVPVVFRLTDPDSYPLSKGFEKTDERIVHEGTDLLACPNGAAGVGELTLTTPWGAGAAATPSGEGVAVFSVDWANERAGALSTNQLASAWQVSSGALKTAATWTPSTDEAKQIAEIIARTKERVVVGATPPQLEVTFEAGANGLEIGVGGQLVLTVHNRGGSTASTFVAKTRSSMPALHGRVFSFGNVQPGSTVTRTLDVTIPDDVVDDAATVLVTFTEGSGNAPAELTKKLPLTRAVCPGGKLTRAKYDEKRGKLKRALAAGDMTQAEFDKFDAELLHCLE